MLYSGAEEIVGLEQLETFKNLLDDTFATYEEYNALSAYVNANEETWKQTYTDGDYVEISALGNGVNEISVTGLVDQCEFDIYSANVESVIDILSANPFENSNKFLYKDELGVNKWSVVDTNVYHDETLTGNGSDQNPLGVAHPLTFDVSGVEDLTIENCSAYDEPNIFYFSHYKEN